MSFDSEIAPWHLFCFLYLGWHSAAEYANILRKGYGTDVQTYAGNILNVLRSHVRHAFRVKSQCAELRDLIFQFILLQFCIHLCMILSYKFVDMFFYQYLVIHGCNFQSVIYCLALRLTNLICLFVE
jgi:hypothetical protein